MRPLRLTLKGFGPYLEEQSVDFSDVELFAITGPTGSGKSTLLEAMAFALYAKAPRVDRGVDLKHPAAKEAWVALTFALGDRVYRVERTRGRRSEARLYEGDRLIPLERLRQVDEALEDLLGLDYTAFTRALLLPQGEFDRFLKGEARERRGLLLQLFELEKLKKARAKAEERRKALLLEKEALEGEAKALEWATPELQAELQTGLEGVQREASRLKGEVGAVEEALKGAEALLALLEDRHRLLARLKALEAEAPRMAELRLRLEKSEEAAKALPLWEDFLAKEKALRETLEGLAKLEGERGRLEEERALLGFDPEALEEAQTALQEAQGLKALEALLRRAGPSEGALAPRFDPEALEGVLERLVQIQVERTALQAWAALLDRLEDLRAQLLALGEERRAVEAKGKEARRLYDELQGAYRAALAWTLKDALKALEGEISGLREGLEEKERALEALRLEERRQGVLAYRDLLQVGAPCPLCGGVVHALPEVPQGRAFDPKAKRALEEEIKALTALLSRKETEKDRLDQELRALEAEPRPGDPEALKERLAEKDRELQELRTLYGSLLRDEEKLLREIARLEGEEEKARQGGVQDPRARLRALEEEERHLKRERADLALGLKAHLEEATGGKGVEAHLKALEGRVKALRWAGRRFQELSQKLLELEGDLKALSARKEEQEKALKEAEARTQGLMPYEEAKAKVLAPEERAALEARLRAHERGLEEARRGLEETERALRARLAPSEPLPTLEEAVKRVEELRKKLDGLRARWEALVQEGGRLQERLEALEEALKRRREVEGRLARLVQELDLWAKLSQDLQEDNFPAYLLGQRQEALLARANELLHALSGDRYRLLADGDDYLVLDRWAEVERPVRTLSGGESFLVSLALALALSEELSKGRLGAFFLDEGFGTLDGETLEMVAGVLEALPTGGRLVGIVTHVEALAERLPARLRVRKTPRGSWVEWA